MGRAYKPRETAEHMIRSYRDRDKAAMAASDHKHSYDYGAPQRDYWESVLQEIYRSKLTVDTKPRS